MARELVERRAWSREHALSLLRLGRSAEPWDTRLLAAVALEHLVWRFDRDACGELGLDCDPIELAARIARRAHLHRRMRRAGDAGALLRAAEPFLRAPCRVAMARFVFTAGDVLARVESDVHVAEGVRDAVPSRHKCAADEAQRALTALPSLERRLVALLGENDRTYWIAPRTSSRLHSLVENPEGTVVLTIKPPGSEVEIEIKRAGSRGRRPLEVQAHSADAVAPLSHHLWGGSQADLLRWERGESNLLSLAYRLAHGTEASLSRTVAITSIYDLPDGANVLAYFSTPELYGDGFAAMQERLRVALRHFELDDSGPPLTLAARFLGRVHPAQAIQIGNSSFRLDRVADYLTARGARRYFREIGELWSRPAAYDLADEVLEECIAHYSPPPRRGGYEAYVRAARSANREEAARAYAGCASQLGTMHGTVASLRGGSSGESFTARNIGLRCLLEDGAWRVRLLFMDHDALNITGRADRDYHPRPLVKYLALDVKHAARSLSLLGQIYGLPRSVARDAFRRAASEAYRATVDAVASRRSFRPLFYAAFRRRLRDWDAIVTQSLERDVPSWKQWTHRFLRKRDYPAHLIEEYLAMIPPFRHLLRRAAFRGGRGPRIW